MNWLILTNCEVVNVLLIIKQLETLVTFPFVSLPAYTGVIDKSDA